MDAANLEYTIKTLKDRLEAVERILSKIGYNISYTRELVITDKEGNRI